MLDLKWDNRAKRDLLAIISYVSEDNPDAAQALKNKIEKQVEALRMQPGMCRSGRVPGTRELVAHNNYVVVYRADDITVFVLRVMHTSRSWP